MPQGGRFLRLAVVLLALTLPATAGCVVRNAEDTPRAETHISYIDAVQDESGGARVTWDDTPRGLLAKFEVYRDGAKIATVEAPARVYVDQDVRPDRTYTYRVRGYYPDGEPGPESTDATFRLRQELAFVQEGPLGRGYVNLSVLSRSPGLEWRDLRVTVQGTPIPLSPSGVLTNGNWTHTDDRDPLVDLGEKLSIRSTEHVRRNATLVVSLESGKELFTTRLDGRPTINLTFEQERNATSGRVALIVREIGWTDGLKRVSPQDPTLAARWSDLLILVNGTRLREDELGSDRSWNHDVPQDDVIRKGERLTIRYDGLLGRGTRIQIIDDVARETAFDLLVR